MPPCDADPASRAGPDAPPPRRGLRAGSVRTTPSSMALAVTAEPASPWLARNAVRAWLEELAWPAELVDDIEYAVSEAVSNAAEHAYSDAADPGPVEVRAAVEPAADGGRRVRVRVRDSGSWRPVEPDPTLRGRGLFMMDTLMDEVAIRRGAGGGGEGTEVVMVSPAAPPARGDGEQAGR